MKDLLDNYKPLDLTKNIQKEDPNYRKSENDSNSTVANEVHMLNKQFLFFLNACFDQNSIVDFSPCALDYLKFVDEIKSKFGANCSSKSTKNDSVQPKTYEIPFTKLPPTVGTSIPTSTQSVYDLKFTHSSPPPTSMPSSVSMADQPTKSSYEPPSSTTSNFKFSDPIFSSKSYAEPQTSTFSNLFNSLPNVQTVAASSANPASIWALPPSTVSAQPFSSGLSSTSFSSVKNPLDPAKFPQTDVSAFLNNLSSGKDSLGNSMPASTASTLPTTSGIPSFSFGNFQFTSFPTSSTASMPFSSTSLPSSTQFQPTPNATLQVKPTSANLFSMSNAVGFNTISSLPTEAPLSFPSIFSQQNVSFTADISSLEKDKNIEYKEQTDEDNQQDDNIKGVESGALFYCKCKLYLKVEITFKEMAVGILNIKSIPTDDSSKQVVFRLESSQADNILLNIKIPKQSTNCCRNSSRDLSITSKANPPIANVFKSTPPVTQDVVTYLVKSLNKDDMDKIVEYIDLPPK